MGTSLTQGAPAAHRITAEDRMERIGQLTTRQLTDALLWLAGYAPSVFDAVAEAVEPCPGDGSEDPAPFCEICDGDLGVFLKLATPPEKNQLDLKNGHRRLDSEPFRTGLT